MAMGESFIGGVQAGRAIQESRSMRQQNAQNAEQQAKQERLANLQTFEQSLLNTVTTARERNAPVDQIMKSPGMSTVLQQYQKTLKTLEQVGDLPPGTSQLKLANFLQGLNQPTGQEQSDAAMGQMGQAEFIKAQAQAAGTAAGTPAQPVKRDIRETKDGRMVDFTDPNRPRIVYSPEIKPTAPEGFRWADSGDALEPIPGGPKDPANTPETLTVAETAVDQTFAKDYADFFALGGIADVQKQVKQLGEVKKALDDGKSNLSGALLGRTPDAIRQYLDWWTKNSPIGWMGFATNLTDSITARDAVEEVVQRNLRLVLGAQFTEKEGERLIARAYNDNLSEAENSKRLGRLMGQIEKAMNTKLDAAKYYEKNGTLKGWKGTLPTVSDFEAALPPIESENDPLGIRGR